MNIFQRPEILDTHVNYTDEPKRQKETYCIYSYSTCNVFLLLHSSRQTVMQIQVFTDILSVKTFSLHALS